MPRPQIRLPGPGDTPIPLTAGARLPAISRRHFSPRVLTMVTRKWLPHPVSVQSARFLGALYGHGINGHAGTISTGAGRNGSHGAADPAVGFSGYATPQVFTGWNPAALQHNGTALRSGQSGGTLPYTSVPGSGSPLDSAMAQIMAGQK